MNNHNDSNVFTYKRITISVSVFCTDNTRIYTTHWYISELSKDYPGEYQGLIYCEPFNLTGERHQGNMKYPLTENC